MISQIESHLEIVSIKEVKAKQKSIIENNFTESELKKINSKHPRTIAGFYAVKIALKKFLNQKYPDYNITENKIKLMHRSDGSPYIEDIYPLNRTILNQIFISISHTAENAYGFISFGGTKK